MTPIEAGLAAPAGMLLISKDGEQERIIYPVHADGWRRLGWTIHPPQPELELEDDEHNEDGEPAALEAEGDELLPAGLLLKTGGQPHQADAIEGRLRRIAAAIREQDGVAAGGDRVAADDRLARVFLNGPNVGWSNGGFRNGGFFNGGFRNGGFYNGGFRNGGFRNGGFRNGGWRNYW